MTIAASRRPLVVLLALTLSTALLVWGAPPLQGGFGGSEGQQAVGGQEGEEFIADLAPLPGTDSTASGTAELRIGDSGKDGVSVEVLNLRGPATEAALLSSTSVGDTPQPTGDPIASFPCESACDQPNPVFTIDATFSFDADFQMLLDTETVFISISTTAFPDGEIGGLLFKAANGGAFDDISLSLALGFNTVGWCDDESISSREFLNRFPGITRVFGFDDGGFHGDSALIPESAGTIFDIEYGDGLFVIASQALTLLLPAVQAALPIPSSKAPISSRTATPNQEHPTTFSGTIRFSPVSSSSSRPAPRPRQLHPRLPPPPRFRTHHPADRPRRRLLRHRSQSGRVLPRLRRVPLNEPPKPSNT